MNQADVKRAKLMTINNLQVIIPQSNQDVRAKVVEHTLVATFRTSNPPTVWRMDLEKNHSFAVAIQKNVNDWELGVVSPKGEFTIVARFHERAAVDAAMAEVEAAMFSNPNSTGIKVWRLSAMTAAMVSLIIVGYLLVSYLGPNNAATPVAVATSSHTVASPVERSVFSAPVVVPVPSTQPVIKGVPQDADAVFGKD
jgi:hypothetical protein